jgi:hypothetical protein
VKCKLIGFIKIGCIEWQLPKTYGGFGEMLIKEHKTSDRKNKFKRHIVQRGDNSR